jgi:hypothetical protein
VEETPDQRHLLGRGDTIGTRTRWLTVAVSGADDRLAPLRECEHRPQAFVLGAEPLQLAQGLVEPLLKVVPGHGCAGRGL